MKRRTVENLLLVVAILLTAIAVAVNQNWWPR